MTTENQKKDRWERVRTHYRLNIMNNETFEEVGSYKLSLLNLYILLCTLLFLGAGMVLLLVLFTPLKKWIPGYQDVKNDTEFLRMERKLGDMEKELAEYKIYTDKLANIVHGIPESELQQTSDDKKIEQLAEVENTSSSDNTQPLESDRSEVEPEEQEFAFTFQDRRSNRANTLEVLNNIYFIPPVSGEISAGFMVDKDHYGVDILAPRNTPVKSVLDGYVISSDWTLETGNTIGIQHDNDMISFYKHNSQLLKSIGDPVRAGEAVAIIGNTGTLSDGPHLHFELWHNGQPLDPEDYIRF